MPIASATSYIKNLLDGLVMPGSPATPNLVAYVTPPDPNVEAQYPTLYVWPTDMDESRDSNKGGTVPRALTTGGPSGFKPLEHSIDLYLVWFQQDDDSDADNLFPGMVDAIMAALRVSADPVVVTDPYTGTQSQLIDVGENMTARITLRSLADQRYDRYDCLIVLNCLELLAA